MPTAKGDRHYTAAAVNRLVFNVGRWCRKKPKVGRTFDFRLYEMLFFFSLLDAFGIARKRMIAMSS